MWRHWHRMSYWRWWWQTQAGRRTKTLLVLAGAAVGGLAGYALAVGAFTSAEAAGRVEVTTLRRVEVRSQPVTVDKLMTIRLDGQTVRKLVPVVRTVTGRSSTLFVTETSLPAVRIHTVTAPASFRPPKQSAGSGRTVTETETKFVAHTVTAQRVVTTPVTTPKTVQVVRTVTQTDAPVTRTATETQTAFVSQPTTVTRTATQTVVQTTPVTTTVGQTTTVTQTGTLSTTRTVTTTSTQTVSLTTTVPVTTTVTRTTTVTQTVPITVTVTVPGK